MRNIVIALAVVASLAACAKPPEPAAAPAASAAATAAFNTGLDVAEVMAHVIDPRARDFWSAWGTVYDETGEHDVSAKTEEDWARVENGAASVILATNTLLLPEYRREPEADWLRLTKDTADIALRGMEAAEKKNSAAMEELGGQLYESCNACHEKFLEMPTGGSGSVRLGPQR